VVVGELREMMPFLKKKKEVGVPQDVKQEQKVGQAVSPAKV